MKWYSFFLAFGILLIFACVDDQKPSPVGQKESETGTEEFQWQIDRFADLKVLRYQIPGFDKLTLDQKKLVYYLTEAGLSGRDIMFDMNYRHNLVIRRALEHIIGEYKGDKSSDNWKELMVYAKRVWFSNGIHHHYGNDKFEPGFTKEYLVSLLGETGATLDEAIIDIMFDPAADSKKVSLDASKDLVLSSAVNFYDPTVTQAEVEEYYKNKSAEDTDEPVSHGLNSKVVKNQDGSISEQVWKADGMYGPAIREIIKWLELAKTVAENSDQAEAFDLLIDYYETGDLKTWDAYNIAWVKTLEGDIDYINSFIEVYNDPLGYKGSYENIIQIKDFEASQRMAVMAENAQWFEDNSTILDAHKKENVVGVTYNVVNVAGESGDASPPTPIGVNLPNANWIRSTHGSKSVSLGNIIDAYNKASGPGMLKEFANDAEEIELGEKYGELSDKLSTALHEVIGHASGKLEPGVGTPKETLKSFSSTLEEARADIIALYFILDPKMVELGLVPSLDVAKAEYDSFISNGLLKQLRRVELGNDIEESHMRNRQLIAAWVFEKGKDDNVISRTKRDGKTYYNINDYTKLRSLFGELLKEIQRIKSQGDYEAGKALVENYGVKVDPAIHKEVLERVKKLDIAPYSGFVNPILVPVTDENGEITDISVEYPDDFTAQMLEYADKYSFLPDVN
jgi:dipeptidyl-peptidase-3